MVINVRRGETQDAKACIGDQVLPPVVGDEALSVVTAVELDNKVRLSVEEVRSADELAGPVVEIRLNLWSGKPGFDQKPAQARLHRRLRRCRQRCQPPEAGSARLAPRNVVGITPQLACVYEAKVDSHIDHDQRIERIASKTQVTKRAVEGRRRETPDLLHVA